MIIPYLKYRLRAGNAHSIHSPFVFDLYTRVIRPDSGCPDFSEITALRERMISSGRTIEVLDLGAGSRVSRSNRRSLREIVKNAEKPGKFGRLFYRLTRHFRPATVLELGTSLGITTLYFARAHPEARILTMEGCPRTLEIAGENFRLAKAFHIEAIGGNIDDTLPATLRKLENTALDLVYFDANHRYEPTLRYFRECLPFAGEGSVFIFDDIYWSEEMTRAWEEIKSDPAVTVTIDLFWVGIVFFRKGQEKEHFVLRF